MWTLSQDITGLLLAVRMKYAFTNLLIYLLTYEYRETFRRGLTAVSRLLIAVDCRRRSLIKLRGLMRIKVLQSTHFCWPDETRMGTALLATHEAPMPPSPSSALTGRVLSGQSTKTNKAASHATIEACVVMSFACVEWRGIALLPTGRWLTVYSGPFRWHQSNDRLWDNYGRFTLCVRLHVGLLCAIV